mmetsp:Transcript_27613/g.69208  ORF Transcript_27613/g.69208 Transcript_27613/m.69208 type:complete len:438 (-) Transcript_27613:1365-2678(-)|eukprot:CAMPEP_0177678890 /NCGR_PEP_ID=MMETSP0447-20121125/29267_1 /TAXON_ID=0 /ORGANISM="Stygamoeba regulata, Strain BSH-02190019" /LENGTH=437 /DNA_ID=CAMNT_0019187957 /DNA_START=83 /DNA_END=1396 /DNA_ORIENTATION=+
MSKEKLVLRTQLAELLGAHFREPRDKENQQHPSKDTSASGQKPDDDLEALVREHFRESDLHECFACFPPVLNEVREQGGPIRFAAALLLDAATEARRPAELVQCMSLVGTSIFWSAWLASAKRFPLGPTGRKCLFRQMFFLVLGKPARPLSELQREIRRHGGEVSTRRSTHTTHVLVGPHVRRLSRLSFREARQLVLLREKYVWDCVAAQQLLEVHTYRWQPVAFSSSCSLSSIQLPWSISSVSSKTVSSTVNADGATDSVAAASVSSKVSPCSSSRSSACISPLLSGQMQRLALSSSNCSSPGSLTHLLSASGSPVSTSSDPETANYAILPWPVTVHASAVSTGVRRVSSSSASPLSASTAASTSASESSTTKPVVFSPLSPLSSPSASAKENYATLDSTLVLELDCSLEFYSSDEERHFEKVLLRCSSGETRSHD